MGHLNASHGSQTANRKVGGSSVKRTNAGSLKAVQSGASPSEVARLYGIVARVLFRWKQDLTQVAPLFVAVEIIDATPPTEEHTS
jgi:hypothetical protein